MLRRGSVRRLVKGCYGSTVIRVVAGCWAEDTPASTLTFDWRENNVWTNRMLPRGV